VGLLGLGAPKLSLPMRCKSDLSSEGGFATAGCACRADVAKVTEVLVWSDGVAVVIPMVRQVAASADVVVVRVCADRLAGRLSVLSVWWMLPPSEATSGASVTSLVSATLLPGRSLC
jgi:hypothetical protein